MSVGYNTVVGRLRHRLDIYEVKTTVDEIGAEVISYTKTMTLWGSIVGLSGREEQTALQVSPNSSHIARIRYNETITESSRIQLKGKIYNIDYINDIDSRRKIMTIYCQEDKSPRGDGTGS